MSDAEAYRKATKVRYVTGIPKKPLAKGTVLVHNQVVPQRKLGLNWFRAWTQPLTDDLVVCRCGWTGADLGGLPHYRVRRRIFRKYMDFTDPY